MTGFFRNPSTLSCDGVSLSDIGSAQGTPLYVYSAALIRSRCQELTTALAGHPHAVHYALKANSTLAVVRLLRRMGCAADANSVGEIEVALRAGYAPSQIVFTGVGKTDAELERAIALDVHAINAESHGELTRIDGLATRHGRRARVALRVNPDIDALSHPHISTGRRTNKFGVPIEEARGVFRALSGRTGLALAGIHVHVGSQMVTLDPIRSAATAAVELGLALRLEGFGIEYVDVGGGLGISYDDGSPVPSLTAYARTVLDVVRPSGLSVVVEPGRALTGPAGVLLTRVIDIKGQPGGNRFVVLDGGMTELLRPALYGAFHRIVPVEAPAAGVETFDFVGPLCETSDTVGANRTGPVPRVGDLYAVLDTGAYGAVMASNYNRRPLPAEVLVDEGRATVVRSRQSIDDMLMWET